MYCTYVARAVGVKAAIVALLKGLLGTSACGICLLVIGLLAGISLRLHHQTFLFHIAQINHEPGIVAVIGFGMGCGGGYGHAAIGFAD